MGLATFGLGESTEVEVPFNYRHHCWFCNEPSQHAFSFPHNDVVVIDCPHPKLTLPCCQECGNFALKAKVDSIAYVRDIVKQQLIKAYRKDLAIGINWTQEELANSQFEGGNFEGFQKSAWFMYEVARDRVNFTGWSLRLNGEDIDISQDKEGFCFDGVTYPSVDIAVAHYAKAFSLPKHFFKQVLNIKGSQNFAAAVRFCRLYVGATPQELNAALKLL